MKTYKISVLGDIMCEPPYMNACKKRSGRYDFWPTFKPLKSLLDEADYVIGNLETPVAGEELGYTQSMVSFNAPYALLEAMKKLGVDLLILANNHAFDRNKEGLLKTMDSLDQIGISYTGAYRDGAEKNRNHYLTLGDTKIAIESVTYSTNTSAEKLGLTGDDCEMVNRYKKPLPGQVGPVNVPTSPELQNTRALMETLLGRKITWDENVMLKKAMGFPIPYPNEKYSKDIIDRGLKAVKRDIQMGKKNADLVISIPHSGGQFNVKPGQESEYVMRQLLNFGADAVLMGHSHTTQKAQIVKGSPCFYSLGNVTMVPNSIYPEPTTLPEYGLIPHLYIANGKIVKTTYTIYKILVDEKSFLEVVPVNDLYERLETAKEKKALAETVAQILARVTGRDQKALKPKKEYVLD